MNTADLNKSSLRSLCKAHGIKNYGALSNQGMRDALAALDADAADALEDAIGDTTPAAPEAPAAPVEVQVAAPPAPAKPAMLMSVFEHVFTAFATDTSEVATLFFGGDVRRAYAALKKLEARGLVVGEIHDDGTSGEGITAKTLPGRATRWQCTQTYDEITLDEARAKFDASESRRRPRPRGEISVKQYIADRLSEGSLSVADLMQWVVSAGRSRVTAHRQVRELGCRCHKGFVVREQALRLVPPNP